MFSQEFINGARSGLEAVRNFSIEAETALDMDNMQGAQKAMLLMVGQAINCQAALTAKFTYEVSKAEENQI